MLRWSRIIGTRIARTGNCRRDGCKIGRLRIFKGSTGTTTSRRLPLKIYDIRTRPSSMEIGSKVGLTNTHMILRDA
jgi:hypothetical protein